ncbi:peptide-N4-(N-acetyl-beta-glucosaminyl)asparagine amidase A [Humulus lupulus]|uniref:peptide-N4-(N-acetyl-beta- glucosaminyl)asparagine amidase A n=1 Tax=Humulus lupulus TaxID=3486 RepID=UPI002B40AE5F|nr:peptide-N4-(N-acetyl-beta-glucosaminyl)asparagine amidase A [Humulus lupulus]
MNKRVSLFLLLILVLFNPISSAPSSPDRFTKSHSYSPSNLEKKSSQEYFELAQPLPSDHLIPSLTVTVLRHSFANTINGPPFSTPYSPPSDFPPPWSYVVVEFRAKCKGEQYDRIAALWIAGVEILRTSTAEPTECGIFWKVRKDVTKYSSLLSRPDLDLTMMLENVVNKEYTGVYYVEVDFLYYNVSALNDPKLGLPIPIEKLELDSKDSDLGLYSMEFDAKIEVSAEEPADLIIPIADSGERGFWFRVESDLELKSREIQFPSNTRRAVVELYVSFHGNDEFWYSNPPNSYITMNNLDTARGNGGFREVFVTIDGEIIGSEIPFPVIFTGGINPLFWEPVVAIGAFNLPTYDFELTPFLGKLLDKKVHKLGIGVSDAISYWLVNANLHLWLDPKSKSVEAQSSFGKIPVLEIERDFEFKKLDGSSKVKAERTTTYIGWVKWSGGNYTTTSTHNYKFKSKIRFRNNGTSKSVKQKIKAKRVVVIRDVGKRNIVAMESVKRGYPLKLSTETRPGTRNNTYLLLTNVSHGLKEKRLHGGNLRRVHNSQVSGGWMEVKDHSVISGNAFTNQTFIYRDKYGSYSWIVASENGKIIRNNTIFASLPILSS